jgi:ferric iron reductase protein FhuF
MCKWQEITSIEREQWREKILYDLFAAHITPVLEMLKKVSRVSSSILWENVAVRINPIYKELLEENSSDKVKRERLINDFNFLKNANGDLFHLKENPLKPYLKIGEELTLNPCRKTFCMYYKLGEDAEGIGYCRVCPIKTNG